MKTRNIVLSIIIAVVAPMISTSAFAGNKKCCDGTKYDEDREACCHGKVYYKLPEDSTIGWDEGWALETVKSYLEKYEDEKEVTGTTGGFKAFPELELKKTSYNDCCHGDVTRLEQYSGQLTFSLGSIQVSFPGWGSVYGVAWWGVSLTISANGSVNINTGPTCDHPNELCASVILRAPTVLDVHAKALLGFVAGVAEASVSPRVDFRECKYNKPNFRLCGEITADVKVKVLGATIYTKNLIDPPIGGCSDGSSPAS